MTTSLMAVLVVRKWQCKAQTAGAAPCSSATVAMTETLPLTSSSANAPYAPAPAAHPSRADQHATLARVASQQSARSSQLVNGVSLHNMPQSVSFANLRAMLTTAQTQGHGQRVFVGSRDGGIVVSVNYNFEPPKRDSGTAQQPKGKKRGRDQLEEAVEQAVLRVKRGLKGDETVSDDMLSTAQHALYTLLTRLRGAGEEEVVESWGLSFKKLEGACGTGGQRPRLILSARLTPGVAVPLSAIFSCLGIRCTNDGMITLQESSSLASGFDLPLSEQARAAELFGQRAITLFATVGQR